MLSKLSLGHFVVRSETLGCWSFLDKSKVGKDLFR